VKRAVGLSAALLTGFFLAFAGPIDGPWGQAVLVAFLLFGPVGYWSGRWAAAWYSVLLLPSALLADALFRSGLGLDSVLATPVALFVMPIAAALSLVGVSVRKLIARRTPR